MEFTVSRAELVRELNLPADTAKRLIVIIRCRDALVRIPGQGEKDSGVNVKTIPG